MEAIFYVLTVQTSKLESFCRKCQKIPAATGAVKRLLEAVGVTLPEALPLRKVNVATRKNRAGS